MNIRMISVRTSDRTSRHRNANAQMSLARVCFGFSSSSERRNINRWFFLWASMPTNLEHSIALIHGRRLKRYTHKTVLEQVD